MLRIRIARSQRSALSERISTCASEPKAAAATTAAATRTQQNISLPAPVSEFVGQKGAKELLTKAMAQRALRRSSKSGENGEQREECLSWRIGCGHFLRTATHSTAWK